MEKNLSAWKVKELKDHLLKLGLKQSGNKPDLIKRIRDYEASKSKYTIMKVPQLKALLKERKLKQTGRKNELVNRLESSEIKKIREAPSPRRTSSPKQASLERATRLKKENET